MSPPTKPPLAKLSMEEVREAIREMRVYYWTLRDGGMTDEADAVEHCLKLLGSGTHPRVTS